MLEGLAARRAATVIGPEQVEHFQSLFREFDVEATETPEVRRAYLRQDYLFHSALELADSQPLTETSRSLNIMVSAFGAGLLRPIRQVMKEHEAIYAALLRRDPDAAEAAMRAHIRPSVEWLHGEADILERSNIYWCNDSRKARLQQGVRSHDQ